MINSCKLISKIVLLCTPSLFFINGLFVTILSSELVFPQKLSNTGRSSISATITRPLGITKTNDINIRSSALLTSDMITIAPYKTIEIRNGGNSNNSKSIVKPASFHVTGEDTFIYSITLPTSVYSSQSTLDSRTVLINNFTSLPEGSGMLNSGAQTIFVGATINFNASLPINKKKDSGDFEIIINYN